MKIKDLQKLDFLLKRINDDSRSKNFKLVFGLNAQTFSGDLIPKVKRVSNSSEYQICFKDLKAYENDVETYINLKNVDDWSSLSTKKQNEFYSKIETLIRRSNTLNSFEYNFLLNETINNISIDFDDSLPLYIYNIESLTTQLPINFMKVNKDTEFDFVSLVPEDTI